jgi:hypothetical protein
LQLKSSLFAAGKGKPSTPFGASLGAHDVLEGEGLDALGGRLFGAAAAVTAILGSSHASASNNGRAGRQLAHLPFKVFDGLTLVFELCTRGNVEIEAKSPTLSALTLEHAENEARYRDRQVFLFQLKRERADEGCLAWRCGVGHCQAETAIGLHAHAGRRQQSAVAGAASYGVHKQVAEGAQRFVAHLRLFLHGSHTRPSLT